MHKSERSLPSYPVTQRVISTRNVTMVERVSPPCSYMYTRNWPTEFLSARGSILQTIVLLMTLYWMQLSQN